MVCMLYNFLLITKVVAGLNIVPSKTIYHDVNGKSVDLPLVGIGTWQYNNTVAYESTCRSFLAGYNFVDTAFGYGNQKGVGLAIRDCWNKSRGELFVMTKIPGGLNTSQVYETHKQNLMELGLDYVDHLMTHFPADWNENEASPDLRREEWLALEQIYYSGEARSIGVSHYCESHLLDIMGIANVLPSINQVEYHVGSQDVDNVMQTCRLLGITFMSFSPLCGPCNYDPEDSLTNGTLVNDIASHYPNVTGSQVALRYVVQQGIPVIPKSNSMKHIESNRDIFNFELSLYDMDRLAAATKPSAERGDCNVPQFLSHGMYTPYSRNISGMSW